MNKKGSETISEQITFIVLNTIFFMALLIFLWRVSSNESALEESYVKTLALTIDRMNPGSQVAFYSGELKAYADKNKITEPPIKPDFTKNMLTVKIVTGSGYSFDYLSPIRPGDFFIPADSKLFVAKLQLK